MVSLLLLNGGVGSRLRADGPKQFVTINGVPILVYALKAADAVPQITEIVINYPDGHRDTVEGIVRDYAISTPVTYVPAGSSRQESGHRLLDAATHDVVIIHESARPLVRAEDFVTLIESEHDNVGFMREIPFTVAPVDPETQRVTGSLERSRLRNVQLPQKFSAEDLRAGYAFAERQDLTYTEDATMCVDAGAEVYFLEGSEYNIKVTTPGDMSIATLIVSGRSNDDE